MTTSKHIQPYLLIKLLQAFPALFSNLYLPRLLLLCNEMDIKSVLELRATYARDSLGISFKA